MFALLSAGTAQVAPPSPVDTTGCEYQSPNQSTLGANLGRTCWLQQEDHLVLRTIKEKHLAFFATACPVLLSDPLPQSDSGCTPDVVIEKSDQLKVTQWPDNSFTLSIRKGTSNTYLVRELPVFPKKWRRGGNFAWLEGSDSKYTYVVLLRHHPSVPHAGKTRKYYVVEVFDRDDGQCRPPAEYGGGNGSDDSCDDLEKSVTGDPGMKQTGSGGGGEPPTGGPK
jgi:hypothetical protein